jgi:phosphoribosyl-ATP pyrophosphohydrolase
MKVKIGQEIKFKQNHSISLAKSGTALVKAGDIARVLRKVDDETAEIIYLTGEAKGYSQRILLEVDDTLDKDAIVKKLLEQLDE